MIGTRMKASFFSAKAVIDSLDRASLRVLSKFGAFVRRTAKSSIRPARRMRDAELSDQQRKAIRIASEIAKREGRPKPKRPYASSKPGEPPRSQTGLLKRLLYFAYDRGARSVIIGPETAGPKTADVLEYGGTTAMTFGPRRGQSANVSARPFMGPALTKEQPKLPAMWRDAMKP